MTAAALLLCSPVLVADDDSGRRRRVEPVGVWNCLVYGPRGDQRFFIRIASNGEVHTAGIRDAMQHRWSRLSEWRQSRGNLTFGEPGSRQYLADLERASLGGTWSSLFESGGWWCTRDPEADPDDEQARPPSPAALMVELIPAIMASPRYPRQAIREAEEGRAVGCFFVHSTGDISHAELMELTDEIFREQTVAAIRASTYRPWGADEGAVRPACRSFTYELDAIR